MLRNMLRLRILQSIDRVFGILSSQFIQWYYRINVDQVASVGKMNSVINVCFLAQEATFAKLNVVDSYRTVYSRRRCWVDGENPRR